jgi:CubicO group peptidase (beta-lactamase class C family)
MRDLTVRCPILLRGFVRAGTFAALIALALALVPGPCAAVGTDRLAEGVDSLFAKWNHPDTPGAAVVLTDGGEIILERCFGMADLEHGVPITPTTRFELASVSKNFTAFGVLLLAQEGRLGLDDDIRSYLPELPDNGVSITIRHLLNQTSGLSEYLRFFPYMGNPDIDRISMRDLLTMLEHQHAPDFPPGSRWAYSNTNYVMLAEIVSRVTERPFGEWMAERVFLPLKMLDTSFSIDGTEVLPNRANAYSRKNGMPIRSIAEWPDVPGADHAFSTIRDMARWIDNFRTGNLGRRDLIREMQRKSTLTSGEETFYGAGLGVGEYRGVRLVGHSGNTGAFKTEMIYCPEIEVGVIVLANDGKMRTDLLARSTLDLYLGDRLEPLPAPAEDGGGAPRVEPRQFVDVEPARLNRFVGGYRLESDPAMLVAVAREGDRLAGILAGVGMDFFQPVTEAEFENRLRSTQLTFFDGPDGRPARVRIMLKGDEMWAARVPLEKDPARALDYVGVYYSDEWGTVYEIVREGEEFLIRHRRLGDRPLQEVEADRLAGGMGLLTFFRDAGGRVSGFVFEEPEDLPGRKIEFRKCDLGVL